MDASEDETIARETETETETERVRVRERGQCGGTTRRRSGGESPRIEPEGR